MTAGSLSFGLGSIPWPVSEGLLGRVGVVADDGLHNTGPCVAAGHSILDQPFGPSDVP